MYQLILNGIDFAVESNFYVCEKNAKFAFKLLAKQDCVAHGINNADYKQNA